MRPSENSGAIYFNFLCYLYFQQEIKFWLFPLNAGKL